MDINTGAKQDLRSPVTRFSEKGCLQVCGGGDALNKVYRELLLAFSSFAKLLGFHFSMAPYSLFVVHFFSYLAFYWAFGVRIMRFSLV
jgi:hypothetical protein